MLIALALSALAAEPVEMDLDAALARFHEASPVVAQIEGRADQARAGARLAVAPALPIVAVQGGYTRNNACPRRAGHRLAARRLDHPAARAVDRERHGSGAAVRAVRLG